MHPSFALNRFSSIRTTSGALGGGEELPADSQSAPLIPLNINDAPASSPLPPSEASSFYLRPSQLRASASAAIERSESLNEQAGSKRRRGEVTKTMSGILYEVDDPVEVTVAVEDAMLKRMELPSASGMVCGVCDIWSLYQLPSTSKHSRRTPIVDAKYEGPTNLLHPVAAMHANLHPGNVTLNRHKRRRRIDGIMPLPAAAQSDSQNAPDSQPTQPQLLVASQRSFSFNVTASQDSIESPQAIMLPAFPFVPPDTESLFAIREAAGADMVALTSDVSEKPNRQAYSVPSSVYDEWKKSVLLPQSALAAVKDGKTITEHAGNACCMSLFDYSGGEPSLDVESLLSSLKDDVLRDPPTTTTRAMHRDNGVQRTMDADQGEATSPNETSSTVPSQTPSKHAGTGTKASPELAVVTPAMSSKPTPDSSSHERTGGTSPQLLLLLSKSTPWNAQGTTQASPNISPDDVKATAILAEAAEKRRLDITAQNRAVAVSPDSVSAAAALGSIHAMAKMDGLKVSDLTFSPQRPIPSPRSRAARGDGITPAGARTNAAAYYQSPMFDTTSRRLELNDGTAPEMSALDVLALNIPPPTLLGTPSEVISTKGHILHDVPPLLLLAPDSSQSTNDLLIATELLTRALRRNARDAAQDVNDASKRSARVVKGRRGKMGYSRVAAAAAATAANTLRTGQVTVFRVLPLSLTTQPPEPVVRPFLRLLPALSQVGYTRTSAGSTLQAITPMEESARSDSTARWNGHIKSLIESRIAASASSSASAMALRKQPSLQPIAQPWRSFPLPMDGRIVNARFAGGGFIRKAIYSTLFGKADQLESEVSVSTKPTLVAPSASRVHAAKAMITMTTAASTDVSDDVESFKWRAAHENSVITPRDGSAAENGSNNNTNNNSTGAVHHNRGRTDSISGMQFDDPAEINLLSSARRRGPVNPLKAADDAPPSAANPGLSTPSRPIYSLSGVNTPSMTFGPSLTNELVGNSVRAPHSDAADEVNDAPDISTRLSGSQTSSHLKTSSLDGRSAFHGSPQRRPSIASMPNSPFLYGNAAPHHQRFVGSPAANVNVTHRNESRSTERTASLLRSPGAGIPGGTSNSTSTSSTSSGVVGGTASIPTVLGTVPVLPRPALLPTATTARAPLPISSFLQANLQSLPESSAAASSLHALTPGDFLAKMSPDPSR